MRKKLRWALPLAQMALAVFLIAWSARWWETAIRMGADMPGEPPASRLLFSLNAPVALLQVLWLRSTSRLDDPLLMLAIGLWWWFVALNIECWRQRRAVFVFSWFPMRLCTDILLVAVGAFWGWYCVAWELGAVAIINGVREHRTALIDFPGSFGW